MQIATFLLSAASWMMPSGRTWRVLWGLETPFLCRFVHPHAFTNLIFPVCMVFVFECVCLNCWAVSVWLECVHLTVVNVPAIPSTGCGELWSYLEPSSKQGGAPHRRACADHAGRPGHWSLSSLYHLPLHQRPLRELSIAWHMNIETAWLWLGSSLWHQPMIATIGFSSAYMYSSAQTIVCILCQLVPHFMSVYPRSDITHKRLQLIAPCGLFSATIGVPDCRKQSLYSISCWAPCKWL